MFNKKLIGVVITCLLLAGCASTEKFTSLKGMPQDVPTKTIALRGENCTWTPNRITVDEGTHILLEVSSIDWDYNFRLSEYDLRFSIPKGETVSAEFYASQTGEFEFGCYIERGLRYYWGGMVGKLIVE